MMSNAGFALPPSDLTFSPAASALSTFTISPMRGGVPFGVLGSARSKCAPMPCSPTITAGPANFQPSSLPKNARASAGYGVRRQQQRLLVERLQALQAREPLVSHVHVELTHRLVHREERVDAVGLLGLGDAAGEGRVAFHDGAHLGGGQDPDLADALGA